MARTLDLVGRTSGKLTVVGKYKKTEHGCLWECACECGSRSFVLQYGINSGKIRSCGCSRKDSNLREALIMRNTTHGKAGTLEHRVWCGMRKRCLSKEAKAYPNYGGRGISICKEWEDFEAFLRDMGTCPNGASLDRIDNMSGYSKENCRWAYPRQQANNKRSTRLVMFDGSPVPIALLADRLKVKRTTLWQRLRKKYGLNAHWQLELSDAPSDPSSPGS